MPLIRTGISSLPSFVHRLPPLQHILAEINSLYTSSCCSELLWFISETVACSDKFRLASPWTKPFLQPTLSQVFLISPVCVIFCGIVHSTIRTLLTCVLQTFPALGCSSLSPDSQFGFIGPSYLLVCGAGILEPSIFILHFGAPLLNCRFILTVWPHSLLAGLILILNECFHPVYFWSTVDFPPK
jgi:hypothetical protein